MRQLWTKVMFECTSFMQCAILKSNLKLSLAQYHLFEARDFTIELPCTNSVRSIVHFLRDQFTIINNTLLYQLHFH